MKNLVDEHTAAVAAVVLAVSISTLGFMLTLAGAGLVVVMGAVLRRAQFRSEARRYKTFASGREHLVANLLVALPYLIAPSDATDDLYREAVSTLHDLAGDDPRPGALFGAALLLAVRARSQVRDRRRAASLMKRPAESPEVDEALTLEVAALHEWTIELEAIDVGEGRYRLVTGDRIEVEFGRDRDVGVMPSFSNPDEPSGC